MPPRQRFRIREPRFADVLGEAPGIELVAEVDRTRDRSAADEDAL